jgi:hypothetical protein
LNLGSSYFIISVDVSDGQTARFAETSRCFSAFDFVGFAGGSSRVTKIGTKAYCAAKKWPPLISFYG